MDFTKTIIPLALMASESIAVLLVEDKSTVLNDSFYLSIIAWSVDVQNLNYRVVLVSERKMLIQTKETHLPSGVSWFF